MHLTGGSVKYETHTESGQQVLIEVLVPACTSMAVALVPLQGDADIYVGWDNLTYPSANGFYDASFHYGSGPDYVILCCNTMQAKPYPSGTPIYLNVVAHTNSTWTLYIFDMSYPIPIEPIYPYGTVGGDGLDGLRGFHWSGLHYPPPVQ